MGIAPDHMVRLGGEKTTSGSIGSGPYGPCSRSHFDRGPEYGCVADLQRRLRLRPLYGDLNLVFSQFDADGKGHYGASGTPQH